MSVDREEVSRSKMKKKRKDKDYFKMQLLWPIFSRKNVKDNEDKNHRITNSKISRTQNNNLALLP